MSTRRIFPEAFKREAVDRVASSGLSVEKVAPSTRPAVERLPPVLGVADFKSE